MDGQDMIILVLKYGEFHPSFDTSFVDSLESQNRRLTDAQLSALENIIDRFRMVKWEERTDAANTSPTNDKKITIFKGSQKIAANPFKAFSYLVNNGMIETMAERFIENEYLRQTGERFKWRK